MRDVGRSASSDDLSGTSSLVSAPGEVFGTHRIGLRTPTDNEGRLSRRWTFMEAIRRQHMPADYDTPPNVTTGKNRLRC
jgi:hypothetical protein